MPIQNHMRQLILKTFILTITLLFVTLVIFILVDHFHQQGRTVNTVLNNDYSTITSKERRALKTELEQLLIKIDRKTNPGNESQQATLSDDLTNQIISLSEKLQPEILESHNGIPFLQSKERGKLFKKVVSSNIDYLPIVQKGDFKYALLDYIDLTSKTLTGIDLEGASLQHAKLDGVDLSGACLNNSILNNATIRGSKLVGTYMLNSRLRNVDFSNSNLQKTTLTGSNFHGSNMFSTNLSDAVSDKSHISRVNFSHSILSNASFHGSSIYKTNFSHSQMNNCNLRGIAASAINMERTILNGSNLSGSHFTDSTFYNTNLSNSTTRYTTFLNVNFENSIIRKAVFCTNFRETTFKNVDFSGTDLTETNNTYNYHYIMDGNKTIDTNCFYGAVFDYAIIGRGVFEYVKAGDNSTVKSTTGAIWVKGEYSPLITVLHSSSTNEELESFQKDSLKRLKNEKEFDPYSPKKDYNAYQSEEYIFF